MPPRYCQDEDLEGYLRAWAEVCLMTVTEKLTAAKRRAHGRQIALPLPKRTQKREATTTELIELLAGLPAHADYLQQRRLVRAIRTALANQLVAWEGSTLHATADGRSWLEVLSAPPAEGVTR